MKPWPLIFLLSAALNLVSGGVFAQDTEANPSLPASDETLEWVQSDLMQAELRRATLEVISEDNKSQIDLLTQELAGELAKQSELIAAFRSESGNLQKQFYNSMTSGQFPGRALDLEEINDKEIPDGADLRGLWRLIRFEMNEQGKVVRFQAPVALPDNEPKMQEIIRVGHFTAFYDGKYVNYQPDTKVFEVVDPQPSRKFRNSVKDLESACEGCLVKVGIDPSAGAILGILVTPRRNPFQTAFTVLALALVGIFFVARSAETSRKLRMGENAQKGYFWGYFFAFGGVLLALWGLANTVLFTGNFFRLSAQFPSTPNFFPVDVARGLIAIQFANIIVSALAAWGTVNRNKYAFVFLTVISVNVLIWIINGIYIYRRWNELDGQPKFSIFKPKTGSDEPANTPATP